VNVSSANELLELGLLYSDRCDFIQAEPKLIEAANLFLKDKNFKEYLFTTSKLLRIYAEMERSKEIIALKEELQALVLKEKLKLDSRLYYTLGLCASLESKNDVALEYLEKSLALGLSTDNKEDICYAISGIAIVYAKLGRFEDSLKEIYNLQVFFQVLPVPELRIGAQIINGRVLKELGKHEQAIDILWKCYEDLRQQKNLYLYLSLLVALSDVYVASGNKDLARVYLGLARKTADPENLRALTKTIERELLKLGEPDESEFDLVFDTGSKSLQERKRGRVDFNNQFVLLDLLKLFIKQPGEVYSKEEIVEKVWKQSYDPSVHDNKLYVTIKRLRKMIEPDFDKPKYIFRAKNGYYLNKNAKVLVHRT
jgi:DNA-binding winged helix-turn-helix (wHTH) protein